MYTTPETFWDEFEKTGSIEAYLSYCDSYNTEAEPTDTDSNDDIAWGKPTEHIEYM